MRELSFEEAELINGGLSDDAQWGAAVGAAGVFLGVGVATAAAPVVAAFALGSSVAASVWSMFLYLRQ